MQKWQAYNIQSKDEGLLGWQPKEHPVCPILLVSNYVQCTLTDKQTSSFYGPYSETELTKLANSLLYNVSVKKQPTAAWCFDAKLSEASSL